MPMQRCSDGTGSAPCQILSCLQPRLTGRPNLASGIAKTAELLGSPLAGAWADAWQTTRSTRHDLADHGRPVLHRMSCSR